MSTRHVPAPGEVVSTAEPLEPVVVLAPGVARPPWAGDVRVLDANILDAGAEDAVLALSRSSCVVLDATAPRFVHSARAVHSLDASVQVVAVTPPEAVAALRRTLLYAPGLGEVWLASPGEISGALTDRAAGVTQQRRSYERTRQRIAREQLSESPQRTQRALISDAYLAGLLRVLPDAVFSVDAGGRILSANLAAEGTFAPSAGSSVVGARLGKALGLTECATGEERTLLTRAVREGVIDVHFRTPASRAGVGELRAIPVRSDRTQGSDARGAAVWAVVLRDVTDERATNELLRDTALELEMQTEELRVSSETLADRTTEAERLRDIADEARAAAEAASSARSEFLATMSHEIRTPINAIVGYTQLLDMGVPDAVSPAQRGQLARIEAAAQHLLGLVNDVLDVAKIDAGEMRIARETGNVERVLAEALSLTLPLAAQRGIQMAEHGDAESLTYVGDPSRVRQVLVNILSNAVKFTSAGGTIAIASATSTSADASARVRGNGPWTLIRITDTGIGIPPDQHAAVFEPFVQAESGKTRTKGGTGLGLTISRRLARLMGGDLTLESTPGVGTAFTLWLPTTDGLATPPAESPAERGERAGLSGSGWRVHGLAEVGRALREGIDGILHSYVVRLRADPALPEARTTEQAQLEDHALTLLADMAQSLVILADAGDEAPLLLADGSAIQRMIAEAHGARRFAQGWSEASIIRDHEALQTETARAVRARVDPAGGDVSEALRALTHMSQRAAGLSLGAYRRARARAENR